MPLCPTLLTASLPRPAPLQTDGERLPLAVKDLGSSDIYPQSLQHSPNGRFVTVRRRLAGPVPAAGQPMGGSVGAKRTACLAGWLWSTESKRVCTPDGSAHAGCGCCLTSVPTAAQCVPPVPPMPCRSAATASM